MVATGDSRLGTTIGNCRLLSVLGAGSTSTVYLGQPLDDPRGPVAVKVLHPHLLGETEDYSTFRKRFEREALAASQLHHERIVPVLDYGETDGTPYMVMPLIDGGTLADRLNQAQQENSPLPLREIERYVTQLASALDAAHALGMVHRDVKPSNILLDRLGRVYLTDFGIARLFNDSRMTKTGQVVGTPYYMAPEQANGDTAVTSATDIYALGVVLYQMVTGEVPFHADTPMIVLVQHIQETPRPPSDLRPGLPRAIEEVILRAMAKAPKDRFATAGDLAMAFSAGLSAEREPEAVGDASQTWRSKSFTAKRLLADASPGAAAPRSAGSASSAPYTALVGTHLREFQLEKLLSASDLGGVFVARPDGFTAPRWLRVIQMPAELSQTARIEYLDRFTRQAEELVTLRHPNILQVLEYGSDRGLVYLVMPEVSSSSLGTVLQQQGALAPEKVTEYLDQITDALACADEHGIAHLNLTPDCVYVDRAGHLLVADFGIRGMASPDANSSGQSPLYVNDDAHTPEQVLGEPVGAHTDVYALGSLLFFMLTGRPVFDGKLADDVAQQHLHSAIPSAHALRAELPTALDEVLRRAMAKDPAQRFQSPAELARAYHVALASTDRAGAGSSASAAHDNGTERPAVAASASSTAAPAPAPRAATGMSGDTGSRARMRVPAAISTSDASSTGQHLSAAESSVRVRRLAVRTRADDGSHTRLTVTPPSERPARASSPAVARPATPIPPIPPTPPTPPTPSTSPARWSPSRRNLGVWIGCVAGLIAVVAGTLAVLHYVPGHGAKQTTGPLIPNASASVSFFDSTPGTLHTDALSVQASGLPTPRAGASYDVWFYSAGSERPVLLGALVPAPNTSATSTATNANNTWTLAYPGASGASAVPAGTNVLTLGNTITITLESGAVQSPIGPTVLSGTFGPTVFTHIKHLLVAFPTNADQKGFLVGMLEQLRTLQDQVTSMKALVDHGLFISPKCAAQNAVNLIEGQSGSHYKSLGTECTSRNVNNVDARQGLLGDSGWVSGASDHASFAIQSQDASAFVKEHAPHVVIACTDITKWLTTVDQDLISVLASSVFDSKTIQEILTLVDHSINGVALNGDEVPGPVAGEAGGVIAFEHGQKMSELPLTPAK